ncbi:stoned B isoform X2 [Oratosquilla oratoria]|uniref:stoned B isoform X2 n=1 Tax=Oratosquilla oratoria TaxID=337810 RepID=UPI003F763B26
MDHGGVKNPFLFDDVPAADPSADAAANPFLNGGAFDFSATVYTGINPFSDQIDDTNAAAAGLFGDPSVYPADMNPFGEVTSMPDPFGVPSVDIFGTAAINHPEPAADLFSTHADPPQRPPPPAAAPVQDLLADSPPRIETSQEAHAVAPGKPPPPRPPPPSKETKDLLQTVIGAMEATTDTLRDKLNTTRTPCPSPGSNAPNTPSPTPDIQVTEPMDKEPDTFSAIFGQTIELSDQEIDETQTTAGATNSTATVVNSASNQTAVEFDLFGAAIVQTKPKTTMDILSLYNKPKEKETFDLLSDDLMSGEPPPPPAPTINSEAKPDENDILSTSNAEITPPAPEAPLPSSELLQDEEREPTEQTTTTSEPPAPEEGKAEVGMVEESVSPEQISEKTDSEPTVIEAAQETQEESQDISVLDVEIGEVETGSTCEDKTDAMEIFGAPEPAPASKTKEEEPSVEVAGTPAAQPEEEPSEAEDFPPPPPELTQELAMTEPDMTNAFGEAEPTNVFGEPEAMNILEGIETKDAFGGETEQNSVFGEPEKPNVFGEPESIEAFGEPEADSAFGEPEKLNVFGDSETISAFGEPEAPPSTQEQTEAVDAMAIFGVAETENVPSAFEPVSQEPTVEKPKPPPVPPINTGDALFGSSDFAPPANAGASLFGDVPEEAPTSATSTGFNIFGEAENSIPAPAPSPAPSGGDSTGAALFGTSAPAPNVGMSLFGTSNEPTLDIFAETESLSMVNPFAPPVAPTKAAPPPVAPRSPRSTTSASSVKLASEEEFDAFTARFEGAGNEDDEAFDPFGPSSGRAKPAAKSASPWGDASSAAAAGGAKDTSFGFGDNAQFDAFLSLSEPPPPPQSTPSRVPRQQVSQDSDDGHMTVVIKPANLDASTGGVSPRATSPVPVLAPPPVPAAVAAFSDTTPRFNPFDKSAETVAPAVEVGVEPAVTPPVPTFPGTTPAPDLKRTDSQETPPTPLYEEDQSQPLETFPRTEFREHAWEMHLRQPNKKKITGQSVGQFQVKEGRPLLTNRFWKKVIVKLTDNGVLQLYNNKDDKDPFQELPLQACYSVSDIGAQQFDQFGKIFTVKVQYIFYKERPGVRPGQITKAERITTKISKFAQYAIAGDYEGVKEFASDVRKLGMPVEHAPQISQLLKLGTKTHEDIKLFASLIEEQLFKLTVHRDRALNYKTEEVQLTAVDELYVEQDNKSVVHKMIARVRIFFLGFLSGMPDVDLGINDMRKQGKEVVGRHDIIPVITEEWIRLEAVEFHCCVNNEEFENSKHIKFKPPDACYIELMRFRVRPPKNRELPLQIKTQIMIDGRRVDISSEILVPGFSGRKLGQVPCEDVAVRFPVPECWIYMFRVEKHFRYGSVKSAHRRTGKVKGVERFKGAVESTAEPALMEVTSGQAKYEHHHRAIVWRMSRLPKEGQGAYTTHQFNCRMNLTAYDQMPETLDRYCYVEFTMPATTVSHCVMRSVSVTNEDPPEKYVRYLARQEYKVEVEFTNPRGPSDYIAATMKTSDQKAKEEAEKQKQQQNTQKANDDSSSDESS